ncbi:hypothetical protein LIER_33168 [Lithospermum erythrorhizon]|uniref:Uncharacterized protein n=1 Tax=Lithospermum erythrorhizon TaxID=34254 RepID=A0AAV3RZ35_LITER
MDIDKHDIQILATKISKILIESSSTLLKTYPKASFALASLFFFYIFFPALLWFLINTIPFIVLIGTIIIKTYISVNKGRAIEKHENDKDGKSKRKVESAEDDNKKYNAKHARSVRRRKSKIIFAESRQNSIQEKEAISSTSFIYDLVDKRPLVEETPKEILEVEVNEINDRVGSSPSDVSQDFLSQFNSILRSQTFGGCAIDAEGISSDKTKDEDDDSRGEDQKNVADIGLAEIERNKRLEILIARRRERKILSLQARRTMMDMGGNGSPREMMYYVTIPKMNSLSPRNAHYTPGSAPPALLPAHNPFDLPYELHEEKPILTEDSFHQEFLGTHPKDMLFCRHKSFSSGSILPGDMIHSLHQTSLHNNHGTNQEVSELQENTESLLGGNVGKQVEQEQSQEAVCDDKFVNTDKNIPDQGSEQSSDLDDVSHEDIQNEEETKSVIVEDYNGRVSSSSSSEENEPIDRLDREKLLRSLSSLDPRNMNIQRSGGRIDGFLFDKGTYKTKETGPFNYPYHNPRHASSLSIASDLQVEVSELSSPRILSDANSSSPDEVRSLCDIKYEEIPDCEDLWKTSSQLSRGEENESRSRDLGQFSEEDTIGVGFSRIEESKIPAERVIEQDSSDPQTNYVSESEIPGDDAYEDHIERIVREQPSTSCPNSPHDLKHENLKSQEDNQLTGTSMTDHFRNTDLQYPKVPSLPTTNPTEELDINMSSPNLQVHNTNNERTIQEIGKEYKESHSNEPDEVTGNLRSLEKFRAEIEHPLEVKDETDKKILVGENVIHNEDTSQNVDDKVPFPHNTVSNKIPEELQNSGSGSDSEEYLKATIINESTGDSSQPTFTREIEGMPEEMLQHTETQDSRSTEGNYIMESTTDIEDEASSIAIATSEPSQFVIQPNEVPPVPESLNEQVPTALSTSSSPKSVLNPMFSANQGSISHLSDIVQMESQPFEGESTSSNSISPRAQNAAPLAEDLSTNQSHEGIERIQVGFYFVVFPHFLAGKFISQLHILYSF